MTIGIDLVRVERLQNALRRAPGFAATVFTVGELEKAASFAADRRAEFLAGRFAVKEAVLKALGVGMGDFSWLRDIETQSAEHQPPSLKLHGSVAKIAESKGLSHWQVSITHESGFASAFVLLT